MFLILVVAEINLWSDIPAQTVNNRGANIYEWPSGSGNFYGRSAENSCISTSGIGDQFMNYMDYVYDDQMRMFSEEQALRWICMGCK